MKNVHQFDNGLKVFDYQLLSVQRERYEKSNVHEEDEEDLFIDIIKGLKKNSIYVSIGTAIGYYPLLAKKIKEEMQIHCFEPLPKHLLYLKENIKLNRFKMEDFLIHKMAVSTSSGKVSFANASYGSSVLNNSYKIPIKTFIKNIAKKLLGISPYLPTIEVKSIPMINIFDLTKSKTIDFVQMDIQGHEHSVLEKYFSDLGSRDMIIKSFLIGTHGINIHNACKQLLENNEYKMVVDEFETKNQPDGIIYCKIR